MDTWYLLEASKVVQNTKRPYRSTKKIITQICYDHHRSWTKYLFPLLRKMRGAWIIDHRKIMHLQLCTSSERVYSPTYSRMKKYRIKVNLKTSCFIFIIIIRDNVIIYSRSRAYMLLPFKGGKIGPLWQIWGQNGK